jgi:hypothetical protein
MTRTKSTAMPVSADDRRPIGVTALSAFSVAAALIAFTSVVSLLWPGGPLEPMWRLNPAARVGFGSMGPWAIVLLGTVSVASAFAAAGLWRGKPWGRRLAMVGLALNALGDLTNAIVHHDLRTLVGVPVAAVIIAYLASRRVRRYFAGSG